MILVVSLAKVPQSSKRQTKWVVSSLGPALTALLARLIEGKAASAGAS